jgi:acyl carrier protein
MHEEQMDKIRQWLGQKSENALTVGLDEDLIENRIIDSLSFMEFIFFLEEITGKEGLLESATVDSFRSLTAIERSFLKS